MPQDVSEKRDRVEGKETTDLSVFCDPSRHIFGIRKLACSTKISVVSNNSKTPLVPALSRNHSLLIHHNRGDSHVRKERGFVCVVVVSTHFS